METSLSIEHKEEIHIFHKSIELLISIIIIIIITIIINYITIIIIIIIIIVSHVDLKAGYSCRKC